MKLHALTLFFPLAWLAPLVTSAPTTPIKKINIVPHGPVVAVASHPPPIPSPVSSSKALATASPLLSNNNDNNDQESEPERGVIPLESRQVQNFLNFSPSRECWNCFLISMIIRGASRAQLGWNENYNDPQWTRGTLPTRLISNLNGAAQDCRTECGHWLAYSTELGYVSTLPEWAWLTYIIGPRIFEILPPGRRHN